MRIAYFSDIHIEIRCRKTFLFTNWTRNYPLHEGPDITAIAGKVDLVVLAGNISTGDSTRDIFSLNYASQVADFVGAPVIFVPGSHEYHGGIFESWRASLLSARLDGVTVLDRNETTVCSKDVYLRILGATLWTDYKVLGDRDRAMKLAALELNDHCAISMKSGNPFMPSDALREHLQSRAWLIGRLTKKHDGPTIVVTHHVPHPVAHNPRFSSDDALSPAFLSDCSDVLKAARDGGAHHWIFGHHHYTVDAEVNRVRLLSAQLGYPREDTGWNGVPVVEI